MVRQAPAPQLRGHVSSYYGFRERTEGPLRRREGPGVDIVVILSLEHDWLIDGERCTSFVGGLRRKRIVARFREEVGLTPKAVARLLRFERARALAGTAPWAEIALECGYYDQSHLINDFRAVTGRTPETFFQDAERAAA